MSPNESTPLLDEDRVDQQTRSARRNGLYGIFCLNFLLFCGQAMTLAPRVQIYEDIICEKLPSRPLVTGTPLLAISDARCKDADIQAELAFVLGMEELLTVFLSIYED